MVVARGWEKGEVGSRVLMVKGFQFYKIKIFGDWLPTNVNILNPAELDSEKWLRW